MAYGLLAITSKRKLAANSALVAETSRQQMKALQEGLGAIRDVLLDGSQNTYLGIYQKADRPMRIKQAQNTFLGAFPRYGLEALGMLLIAALALLLKMQRGDTALVIPLLGTLALGAQRLLPALQQIYANWAGIRAYSSAVADVLAMLNQPMPQGALQSEHNRPLPLNAMVQIKNLSFRYGLDAPMVLQGLDLEIKKGERIGIIGSTGSGKSTLVDLLMGLLVPSGGQLLVDGVDI
ncbi:ATP-binding cassette domain-containing protein, partial [Cyanobium sp. L1E-Cus]|uniref:ATP-binding cassette domain-containing protein n=1 Tax=Cyanobium sp. L1E-Cus TaxID=2823714 RepID=UPI0020CBC352